MRISIVSLKPNVTPCTIFGSLVKSTGVNNLMKVLPTEKEMLFIFHGKIKPGIYVAEIAKTTAFGIQNRETSKA